MSAANATAPLGSRRDDGFCEACGLSPARVIVILIDDGRDRAWACINPSDCRSRWKRPLS